MPGLHDLVLGGGVDGAPVLWRTDLVPSAIVCGASTSGVDMLVGLVSGRARDAGWMVTDVGDDPSSALAVSYRLLDAKPSRLPSLVVGSRADHLLAHDGVDDAGLAERTRVRCELAVSLAALARHGRGVSVLLGCVGVPRVGVLGPALLGIVGVVVDVGGLDGVSRGAMMGCASAPLAQGWASARLGGSVAVFRIEGEQDG